MPAIQIVSTARLQLRLSIAGTRRSNASAQRTAQRCRWRRDDDSIGRTFDVDGHKLQQRLRITGDRAQLAPGCTYNDLVNQARSNRLSNYFNKIASRALIHTTIGCSN